MIELLLLLGDTLRKKFAFQTIENFYNALYENMNEDGYAVCSIFYAGTMAQTTAQSALVVANHLQNMGCIKIYEMNRRPIENRRPGTHDVKGGTNFRIIKILRPVSEKTYRDYWAEIIEKK